MRDYAPWSSGDVDLCEQVIVGVVEHRHHAVPFRTVIAIRPQESVAGK
jgi:hypothetical protein